MTKQARHSMKLACKVCDDILGHLLYRKDLNGNPVRIEKHYWCPTCEVVKIIEPQEFEVKV